MLSTLKSIPGVRQLGRWYINTFMEGSVTPIRSGYAQGMLWTRRRRYVNACWMGDYEPVMQATISALLKPGHTFYDIGANAGFFSLLAWKQIGTTGKVVSVDPDAKNIEHLEELKKNNRLEDWTMVREAVSDKIGTCIFETREAGDSGGHLQNRQFFPGDNPMGTVRIEVPTTTFDALVQRHGKPDVMKIDIEGAEFEAFRGGIEELLNVHRPVLIMELHGNERARFIQEVLLRYRYQLATMSGEVVDFERNDIYHIVAKPR